MYRFSFAFCALLALSWVGVDSSQAQPPSNDSLSPMLRQRIDEAFTIISDPNIKGRAERSMSLQLELKMQRDFIARKLDRFLQRGATLEDEKQKLEEYKTKLLDEIGFTESSRETVELLLRNNMLETQRLNWQVVAENVPVTEKLLERRDRLARARIEDVNTQLAAAEQQVSLQRKKLDRIETLMKSGQVPSSELLEEQSRTATAEMALDLVRNRRQELELQMEIERETELEKLAQSTLRTKEQRQILVEEQKKLMQALQRHAALKDINRKLETCQERIRENDRLLSHLEVQRAELDVLIEFLPGNP